MSASRFQDRFVFGALLLTLLLAVLLAANAMVTARYHRSVAEGVLRDYADYAASELANRVQSTLAQRLFPVLGTVLDGTASDGARLPSAEDLRARTDSMLWRVAGPGLAWFRVGEHGATAFSGASVAESARAVLATMAVQSRNQFTAQSYLMLRWPPAEFAGRMVALMRGQDGTIGGVVVPGDAVTAILEATVRRAPLLPPSLTGGSRLDSVVTYEVRSPSGVVLASRWTAASPFRGTRSLSPSWGDLQVRVALDESLAGRLVIGGLPRSRLPVVGALLGLTVVLIGAALMQLRRQREFARQRDEFVAGVSHELRTPLAQIRLFTETLRLGRVRSDSEAEQSLSIIDRESRRLTWMVENLLAVSRVSRGVLTVAPRELDLAAELRETIEGFEPLAASRGASLAVTAPGRLIAHADAEGFRQIVLNLLDNAVKYGPRGQTVRVALEADNGMVRLSVEDEGRGVPAADRDRVFERFVRLREGDHAHAEGTGLGLALVRELATLHHGRARVEPGERGGARFVVELASGVEG